MSSGVVTWWFVFREVQQPFLAKFLKREYGHVFAFVQLNNVCLVIEPMLGASNHTLIECPASKLIAEFKSKGMNVVAFNMVPIPHQFTWRTPLITCATYLAYTIGLPFYGFTSWQLYKKLKKLGAKDV